ncbi:hypothetical protein ABPG75_007463 [Micractinium tetrahymenae]
MSMSGGGLPAGLEPPGERSLALVMHTWGHPSTFYSWVFMKQYLLRRREQDGEATLAPGEKLYMVKAGKPDEAAPDRWKVGGPLIPDLDTALAHYPHELVKLEGSVKSNIHTFLAQYHIDILVIPAQWPGAVLSALPGFTTVSEWVKQNVNCPYIITRRDIVVNARMKISSQLPQPGGGSPREVLERASMVAQLPLSAASVGRRIAVAYNSFSVGRGLLQFARDKVLTRNDTVYICHVFSNQNPVVKETIKFMRAVTLQKSDSLSDEVTRDNSYQFGAAELAGYNVQLGVTLQGDAKSAISSFCESEEIELLIIGSRSGGKIRKRLSGGGVSSHLIDNASCPCLVVPYKWMGVDDGGTIDEELASSPSSPAAASLSGWASPGAPLAAAGVAGTGDVAVQTEGTAAPSRAAPVAGTVAAAAAAPGGATHSTPSDLLSELQRQLEEKDRTIAELRGQVQQLQLAAAQRRSSESFGAAQVHVL